MEFNLIQIKVSTIKLTYYVKEITILKKMSIRIEANIVIEQLFINGKQQLLTIMKLQTTQILQI